MNQTTSVANKLFFLILLMGSLLLKAQEELNSPETAEAQIKTLIGTKKENVVDSAYYLAIIQQPYDEEEAKEATKKSREAFQNLPEKIRKKYLEHLSEASRYLNQKRIIESLNEAYQAEKIYDGQETLYNIIGSGYSELRNFSEAMKAFEKALRINPYHRGVRFNMAEMEFVTHDWKNAEIAFASLAPLMSEQGKNSLYPLIKFKLLICKLKLGKTEDAEKIAAKYDHSDDTPFHYYAQATLAYERGDNNKAAQWISTANKIFRKVPSFQIWNDALIESGYLLSYYGGIVDIGEKE